MSKLTALASAGIATVALSLALVGCGSDTKTVESTAKTSTEKTTSAKAEPTAPSEPGTHKTIQDYVKENNIQQTVIKRGDPGLAVNLQVPAGWVDTTDLPEAPYQGIVYQDTAVPDNPPRILVMLSKLTGNVDPQQLLALAPGELLNIPGYDGPTEGQKDSIGGYDAVALGGTYQVDGKPRLVAQKTAVISSADGVYLLQFKASADESEMGILGDATIEVDRHTTITP